MHDVSPLSENVDRLVLGDRTIYLVGTAHLSHTSVALAEEMIRRIRPDTVAIELCDQRYQSLQDPDRWKNTDLYTVIKSGNAAVLTAQIILSAFQKKLGDQLGIRPGEEMLQAARVARECNAQIVCIDRNIKITLKRTWANLGLWTMIKLVAALVAGLITERKISADEIEDLKKKGSVNNLLEEFAKAFPRIQQPLITERDQYMAGKLAQASGRTIVAIVGAGHVPGMRNLITTDINLTSLENAPKSRFGFRTFLWILSILTIGFIAYGFMSGAHAQTLDVMQSWFIITGFSAALGSALGFAHPITVIATFFTAPLVSLNPLFRPGWVSALVEAVVRKPKVSDLERVTADILSVHGIWKNGVSRILLILILTNMFGLFGALYGLRIVASLLQ